MIKEILENVNSYHSRLKFTHEIEFENTLSFLNLLMIKKEDGVTSCDDLYYINNNNTFYINECIYNCKARGSIRCVM